MTTRLSTACPRRGRRTSGRKTTSFASWCSQARSGRIPRRGATCWSCWLISCESGTRPRRGYLTSFLRVVVVEDALREITATKQAGFVLERIPSEAFDDISTSVRTCMYGPINSRVRVAHLQPIHYLATLLDPSQFDADRACLYFDKAKEALIQHFGTSPLVFREKEMTTLTVDDRIGVLLYQPSAFISATGSFAGGVQHRHKRCKHLIVGTAWWWFFGSDYNEFSRIAVTVLSLSPSSAVVERSFSQQKNVHSQLRNRLEHGKVKKLMYLESSPSRQYTARSTWLTCFESVLELDEDDDIVFCISVSR
jgi:hAT family C-terminal dimerisation region